MSIRFGARATMIQVAIKHGLYVHVGEDVATNKWECWVRPTDATEWSGAFTIPRSLTDEEALDVFKMNLKVRHLC